jgi:hypothetical protein
MVSELTPLIQNILAGLTRPNRGGSPLRTSQSDRFEERWVANSFRKRSFYSSLLLKGHPAWILVRPIRLLGTEVENAVDPSFLHPIRMVQVSKSSASTTGPEAKPHPSGGLQ